MYVLHRHTLCYDRLIYREAQVHNLVELDYSAMEDLGPEYGGM